MQDWQGEAPEHVDIKLAWAYRLLNFGPLTLCSSTDGERANVCTVAWCMPVSKDPPRFALRLGQGHKTYKNMRKTGMLGINVPTQGLEELALFCGHNSGHDVDKIAAREISLHAGKTLAELPLVSDCAAWLECRWVQSLDLGDGDLTIVEAVAASARPKVLDITQSWDGEMFRPLHHAGGSRFLLSR